MSEKMEKIGITTEYIKLDSFLKFSGTAVDGVTAKMLIQRGLVQVNGEPCDMRGKKLYPGDIVNVAGELFEVVTD